MPVIQEVLEFFGYLDGAALKIFNGTLKLRYSSTPFARRFPLGQSCVSLGRPQRLVQAVSPGFILLIMTVVFPAL